MLWSLALQGHIFSCCHHTHLVGLEGRFREMPCKRRKALRSWGEALGPPEALFSWQGFQGVWEVTDTGSHPLRALTPGGRFPPYKPRVKPRSSTLFLSFSISHLPAALERSTPDPSSPPSSLSQEEHTLFRASCPHSPVTSSRRTSLGSDLRWGLSLL